MKPLNPQQQRFVDEYLLDLNATEAYKRAGYKAQGRSAENAASRLLGHVGVKAAIEAAIESRRQRVLVDQDYVIRNTVEVLERCMQRAPVMTPSGQQATQQTENGPAPLWRFDAKNALQALKLLGLHCGTFAEKHEHSGPGGGPIPHSHDVHTLTAADIAAARGLLGMASGDVQGDGGPQPVDPDRR